MASAAAEVRIRGHFERFLENKFGAASGMSAPAFDINPFLLASVQDQLLIRTPNDLAAWLVRQRVERSLVTGFGSALQSVAREFCNDAPRRGMTARLTRGGTAYNMIIKSNPNHSVPVMREVQRALLLSKENEPGSVPVFGACCGRPEQAGAIVRKYTEGVRLLVGRELWEFLSGDPGCHRRVFELAARAGRDYRDPEGRTLDQIIEQKTKYVERQLRESYGDDPGRFWKGVLEGSC